MVSADLHIFLIVLIVSLLLVIFPADDFCPKALLAQPLHPYLVGCRNMSRESDVM